MELKTITREEYDKGIAAQTAVDMVREYLDECETPDAEWIRYLLDGCPLADWQVEILRELDCPEEHKKVTPRTAMRDVEEI